MTMAGNKKTIYDIVKSDTFCQKYTKSIKNKCIITDDENPCWMWTKCKNGDYGHMSYTYEVAGGKEKGWSPSHRLMFACHYNQLHLLHPEHKFEECSHRCPETLCCNPDHIVVEIGFVNKSRRHCHKYKTKCTHKPACIVRK